MGLFLVALVFIMVVVGLTSVFEHYGYDYEQDINNKDK